MNILVVHDEQVIRDMISRRLTAGGHQVWQAADSDQTDAVIAEHPDVEIVVADIQMPGRTGIDLLRDTKLRRADIEFILITGYAELESAAQAVGAHAFAYLRKPLRVDELLNAIGRAAEHIQLRRDREQYARELELLVARLEESERRYRTLVDGVPGAVIATDLDLVVSSAGERSADVLGCDPAGLVGTSVDALRRPDQVAQFRGRAAQLLEKGGGGGQFEGQIVRADGTTVPTLEVVIPVKDDPASDRPTGFFWIIQDASAAQRLKEKAELAWDYLDAVRRSRSAGQRIVGESRAIKDVLRMIRNAAPTNACVLICGESGTGKELVAESVHLNSTRAGHPFVVVSSAALPESLLERELLGYRKGAFTGAAAGKRGLVEIADGGTLFLDEVAEMAPAVQAKMLRVLEQSQFRRLGSTEDRTADIRVVAATNRDLAREVRAGRFREDLMYRLDVIRIDLPPLRGRLHDVPLIAQHQLEQKAGPGRPAKRLTQPALDALMAYDWPGNVRELRNVIERATILSGDSDGIEVRHLSAVPATSAAGVRTLRELEDTEIDKALALTDGNKTRASKLLGITRQTLISRLERRDTPLDGPQPQRPAP